MALGQESPAYQRALHDLILRAGDKIRVLDEHGQVTLYRPGELLCHKDDQNRVADALAAGGHRPTLIPTVSAEVVKFKIDPGKDIPRIVRDLRNPESWGNKPPPQVQPHHMVLGTPNMMGGPIGPPEPADTMPSRPNSAPLPGAGLTIGICDTGIAVDAATVHPKWLGGDSYTQEED